MDWYSRLVTQKLTGAQDIELCLSAGILMGLKSCRGDNTKNFALWSVSGQTAAELSTRLRDLTKKEFARLIKESKL